MSRRLSAAAHHAALRVVADGRQQKEGDRRTTLTRTAGRSLMRSPSGAIRRICESRRSLYCSAVPPGPGKAAIGVPSVELLEMRLFLKDCRTPRLAALTPVTLLLIEESPMRANAL